MDSVEESAVIRDRGTLLGTVLFLIGCSGMIVFMDRVVQPLPEADCSQVVAAITTPTRPSITRGIRSGDSRVNRCALHDLTNHLPYS